MWRLLNLGGINGYTMTNLYEVIGTSVSSGSSTNTLILNHPISPFVNIGYHQLLEKEIDIQYAKAQGFDLVRRTIGGGAIIDGSWEQDYFVIVHKKSPECPTTIPEFYHTFLQPILAVLKSYDLPASIRPPNDILVNNRKISGNGAITVENTNVLAGDILMESPVELMSRIIKAPSEKFRDKVADSMSEWITSLSRELTEPPTRTALKEQIVTAFETEFNITLEPGVLTETEKEHLERLIQERRKHEWIYGKDLEYQTIIDPASQQTKVREGAMVYETVYKAAKLIRITLVALDNKIQAISIAGDFFTQPYLGGIRQLEKALIGASLLQEPLETVINTTIQEIGLRILGASPADIVTAILQAKTPPK